MRLWFVMSLWFAMILLYGIDKELFIPNISECNLFADIPNIPTTTINNINPSHLIHLINNLIINSLWTFINNKFEQFVRLSYILLGTFIVCVKLYYC